MPPCSSTVAGECRSPTSWLTAAGRAQVTRLFRYWSIYLGAENLTGYKQKNPIVEAGNPWSRNFDSTMVWGPVHGAVFYLGVRVNWTKI